MTTPQRSQTYTETDLNGYGFGKKNFSGIMGCPRSDTAITKPLRQQQ